MGTGRLVHTVSKENGLSRETLKAVKLRIVKNASLPRAKTDVTSDIDFMFQFGFDLSYILE